MDVSLRPHERPALKLLMTADAVGGVWQYSIDLLSSLARYNVQAVLATMGPKPSAEQRRQILDCPGVILEESDFALEWMPDPWADMDASHAWLRQLQDRHQPDLIHLNGYSQASAEWSKPVVSVAHSCVYSWWRAVRQDVPDASWFEYHRRVANGLRASDAVVAPSAFMADCVAAEYQVEPESVRIIHNFALPGRVEEAEKEPFHLAAGRLWDPAKNLAFLDEIAPRLEWPVKVAGSAKGPDGKSIAAPSLELLGSLSHDELRRTMAGASIFVHPALYEPFGLAVLEAACRGCCLVLADIPSLRELWDGAALFCHPRNPAAWISQLNRLSQDNLMRVRYAERARQHARRYRASDSAKAYLDLYRWLLSRNSSDRGVAA